MSHVSHELHEQLPEYVGVMDALKGEDAHLARMMADYHTINRTVHRMETDIEPVSDETLRDARKQRLYLLDEIRAYLQRAHV